MGFFSGGLKNVSTLSPEQERLQKLVGSRLSAMSDAGPEGSTYQGPLSAPIGQDETNNIGMASRLSALQEGSLGSMINYNDKDFNDKFQSEIADPTYQDFQRNVLPGIQESLPSFSTAQGNVTARSYLDLSGKLLQQRFAAREAAKNRSIDASNAAQNLVKTNAGIYSIPREIQQAGLDRALANFYKGNEAYSGYLNSMLNYLGIQTFALDRQPSTLDNINSVLNTVSSAKDIVSGGGISPNSSKAGLLDAANQPDFSPLALP